MEREIIACPRCGATARRAAVYRDQYISGETVATGRTPRKHEALDDKGRINLTRVVEAQHEMVDKGAALPDVKQAISNARRMYKAGAKSAVARTD
jgi:DNA-binding PadR family transcriptional regulator